MTGNSGAEIITFYSYKGGTGRSMHLANIAWILASNGKRVLVVDWDLEAPGLHRYFRPFLVDKDLIASEGLIDLMWAFTDAAMTPVPEAERAHGWHEAYVDLLPYTVAVRWSFQPPGRLDLLPAGRQDKSYSRRVNSFNWQNFYDRLGGGVFLEALKAQMRKEYDYVLIDSRTGVSDTAGVCTVQMPDTIVACFTANGQSIEGCASVIESIRAQWGEYDSRSSVSRRVVPVLTRIDSSEQEKLDARRVIAHQKFDLYVAEIAHDELEDYWRDIEVPYIPWYSYEETLAVFVDKYKARISVLASAEALTRVLTRGEVRSTVRPAEKDRRAVLQQFSGTGMSLGSNVILFLPANPDTTSRLVLERECATIERELRTIPYRDDFEFHSRWIVTVDDVMRSLNELMPVVIHFSGYSTGGEVSILLGDGDGGQQRVDGGMLARLVGAMAPSVRMVVLNGCYSDVFAEALCDVVDCVVGVPGPIGDDAARAFATGFYRALGNRRSVGNALDQATATLIVKQYPDEMQPRYRSREGIDVHDVVLQMT